MKKQCSKCKKIKLVSEFYRNSREKDGYNYQCKTCSNKSIKIWQQNNLRRCLKATKKWQKNNSEKVKEGAKRYRKNNAEYFREWRMNNRGKLKEYFKEWQKNNREKCRKATEKYRENNRERYTKNQRKRYRINPAKAKEASKRWQKNNLEKVREYMRKCHKKRNLIPQNRLSKSIRTSIWLSLKGNKNGRHWETIVGFTLKDLMAYLEKQFRDGMSWDNYGKWHLDHVYPVSSFDFNSYEDEGFKKCWALSNLQPLWAFENISKGNKIGGGL